MNLHEPLTDALISRDCVSRLLDRLNHSRCIDDVGAEFAVHTLDLSMVISILEQVIPHVPT